MKTNTYIIAILIAVFICTFQSCGESDPTPDVQQPTGQELFTQQLNNPNDGWTIANGGSVTIDGVHDATDEWLDFKLSFNNFKYITVGGKEDVWPSSGTWKYAKADKTDEILRDNGVLIYASVSGSSLTLRFTTSSDYSTGGRVEALGGEYTFVLK
jgi:hypothetical protein